MRSRWACPDLGADVLKPEGMHLPVPGSDYQFADCPAYGLRTARMGMPAEHLIEGVTHPNSIVSTWALEVESGSRNIESLPTKGVELVHLRLNEARKRDAYVTEMRKKKAGN